MKKAIYLLGVSVLLTGVIHAAVLSDNQLVEMKEQVAQYEAQVAELSNVKRLNEAKIFELTNVNTDLKAKVEKYVSIVNVKDDTIKDLQQQLKVQQKEEERARLLSVKAVFDANDVTKPSNVGVERLTKALKGTNLEPLAPKFVEIEKTHGINAIYLAAKSAWESGWATSDQAIYKNNIGGVKNPGGNGYRTFASKEACLDYIADFLSISYLNEDGKYYNGKSVKGISQNYNFGDQDWIDGVTSVGIGLEAKANQLDVDIKE